VHRYTNRGLARGACILGLLLLSCAVPTANRPADPLDFPWGASGKDLVAQYGERIHPVPPQQAPWDAYHRLEIRDYEIEGLRFVATFRVNRETDALGEVLLVRSASSETSALLLSEFERLEGVFSKRFGVADARTSDTGTTSVARGVIWSKGSPWVLLRYDYAEGVLNSITIHLQQASRRTVLGYELEPAPSPPHLSISISA
jgi:hypothetical protein